MTSTCKGGLTKRAANYRGNLFERDKLENKGPLKVWEGSLKSLETLIVRAPSWARGERVKWISFKKEFKELKLGKSSEQDV